MPTSNDILAIVLGGGQGTRLYPLTKERAKPAVPIAGQYRLIDIPLSNCINAKIHKIAVLTQFNSVSLHRHISQTYMFDAFSQGWVHIWAAEQTFDNKDWYQGTADAVRKQLLEIQSAETEYTLILAGDHLYRMNYDDLAAFHWETGADITVAAQPILAQDAPRFGLLNVNPDSSISEFAEKPKDPEILEKFVSRDDPARPYLGSMGIYMFRTEVLVSLLENSAETDFGKEIIPSALGKHTVYAFDYDGYWQDIGTIRAFYETNLSLTQPNAPFRFHDQSDPIYTRPRFLPGSIVWGGEMTNVMLAAGCHIERSVIRDSVIGLRSQVFEGAQIHASILMGADYYDAADTIQMNGGIPIGVGNGSAIDGAILDKNVRIGKDVTIKSFPPGTEMDDEMWTVRDGIVVVHKNAVLPDGAYIGP